MGLLNLIPGFQDSPVGSWWNTNNDTVSGALTGLVGHGNDPRAILMGALGGLKHGKSVDEEQAIIEAEKQQRQAELDKEAQQQSFTRQRLTEWGPEYQPYVDALDGGMSPLEVWNSALKQRMGVAQGDETFFGSPMFTEGPEGLSAHQLGNRGTLRPIQVPEGHKLASPTETVDTGAEIITTDRFGNVLSRVPKQGAPSPNLDVTLNPDGTRAATPIGGTEQDREARNVRTKAQSAFGAYNAKTDNMLSTIDKAKQESNFGNTGVLGFLGTLLPGFWATDYQKRLNTIAAYTGFKELQDMRDASPTGGALGQVTEKELELLQSVIVSVAQSQSEAQLDENLKVLEDFLRASRERVKAAYEAEFSGAGGGGAMPDPLGIR